MNDTIARINRVVDYIEAHLGEELTLEELAGVAHFSKFHFHRIFSSLTGERLGEFVSRHRLETAASRLIWNPRTPVTEIALSCGFAGSASFCNAFRRRFGMSPTRWRRERRDFVPRSNLSERLRKADEAYAAASFHTEYREGEQIWRVRDELEEKTVVVKTLPPLCVAYVRYTGVYKGDAALFERVWEQLARWAGPRGWMAREGAACMNIYHNYPELTEDDKLRFSACLSVPPGTRGGGDVGIMDLPGGRYACYEALLGPQDYQKAWEWVYKEWLPVSGYQLADRLPREIFPSQEGAPPGYQRVEIAIPLMPL